MACPVVGDFRGNVLRATALSSIGSRRVFGLHEDWPCRSVVWWAVERLRGLAKVGYASRRTEVGWDVYEGYTKVGHVKPSYGGRRRA